jgi:glycosyltransferase involved in cell wall biosynthesis
MVENHRVYQTDEKKMKQPQRIFFLNVKVMGEKAPQSSSNRRKSRVKLARIYLKISSQSRGDAVKLPKYLATSNDIVLYDRNLQDNQKKVVNKQLTIVNQFFPPDYAATGQLIEELAYELKGNFDRVSVFSSQPAYAFKCDDLPPWEHHQNISIRRSRSAVGYGRIRGKAFSGLIFFLRTALHLLRHAHRRQLVLLTTAPPFLPLLGYFFNLCFQTPYVCLLYDLYPDIAIELNVIDKQHWLTKIWESLNCLTWKKASAIIVLNSTMKDRIVKKCPEIADKITIIPNWCDTERIQPLAKKDNWFAKKNKLADRFTVMYSGNMGRCHDMETLVNAMIILRDSPIQFVFIGSGDKRKYVQDKIETHGLNNCLFFPYQSKENLPYSITAGDVAIVSIDEQMEGLVVPSKLYSALAAGTPVAAICPAHSYLHSVLSAGNCGDAFVNGDSQGLANYIDRLSKNPELVRSLGRSARAYCLENYTKERVAQDYLKLFKSLP